MADALVDMTGGLPETINLEDERKIPSNLYDLLLKSSQMNSLIAANIFVRTFCILIYSVYLELSTNHAKICCYFHQCKVP